MEFLGWRGDGPMLMAALMAMLTAGLLVPTVALARPVIEIAPSLSVTEIYDDNLFSSPSRREKILISRFSPGIRIGYLSGPLTLLGRYVFDAEFFNRRPELNKTVAGRHASIEFRHLPTGSLTLSMSGAFVETRTPTELNTDTGLEAGRAQARRFSLNPSVRSRFNSLTTGTAGYAFMKDELSGGVGTLTHAADLGLDRRITPWDTGSLGYAFRQFAFEEEDTTEAHTLTVGWTREITSKTRMTLRGGPRFSEGSVEPDVMASIRRRLKHGELSLTYGKSRTTVIGQAGAVNTDSLVATVAVRPLRSLRITAAPGFFRSRRAPAEAKVYRLSIEAAYRMTDWLSLTGSYQHSRQRGQLDSVTGEPMSRREEIDHTVFSLRITAEYPSRISGENPGENP